MATGWSAVISASIGVRINHLLTILRRFPGVSIDLRVQGSVIAVKRALDHRAHSMALRAMLIDLEPLVARGCRHSDDGCFSAAAAHFMRLVIRPFAQLL